MLVTELYTHHEYIYTCHTLPFIVVPFSLLKLSLGPPTSLAEDVGGGSFEELASLSAVLSMSACV